MASNHGTPSECLALMAEKVAAQAWDCPEFLETCIELRKMTCTLEDVGGVLQEIVDFMSEGENRLSGLQILTTILHRCPQKQVVFNTLWILTNVASGESALCTALVQHGVVPLFISLLEDEDLNVVEQAGWGLGNLAGDCVAIRDMIHDAGGVAAGIAALRNPLLHSSGRANITWTMSNLCRGKPAPRPAAVRGLMEYFGEVMRKLIALQEDGDGAAVAEVEKEIIDVLWGVSYVTDGPNEQVQLGIDLMPLIVAILSVPDAVEEPGFGDAPVVERLVASEQMAYAMEYLPKQELERLCMLNSDIWNCCVCANRRLYNRVRLAVCHKKEVRVPAVRIIGNVLSGTDAQTQAAIDCGALRVIEALIPSLVPDDSRGAVSERKEVCWLLSNVTAGTPVQCRVVLKSPVFCNFLLDALRPTEHVSVGKEAAWAVSNALASTAAEVPINLIVGLVLFAQSGKLTSASVLTDSLNSIFGLCPTLGESVTRTSLQETVDSNPDPITAESLSRLMEETHPQTAEHLSSLMATRLLPALLAVGALDNYEGIDDGEVVEEVEEGTAVVEVADGP